MQFFWASQCNFFTSPFFLLIRLSPHTFFQPAHTNFSFRDQPP